MTTILTLYIWLHNGLLSYLFILGYTVGYYPTSSYMIAQWTTYPTSSILNYTVGYYPTSSYLVVQWATIPPSHIWLHSGLLSYLFIFGCTVGYYHTSSYLVVQWGCLLSSQTTLQSSSLVDFLKCWKHIVYIMKEYTKNIICRQLSPA